MIKKLVIEEVHNLYASFICPNCGKKEHSYGAISFMNFTALIRFIYTNRCVCGTTYKLVTASYTPGEYSHV